MAFQIDFTSQYIKFSKAILDLSTARATKMDFSNMALSSYFQNTKNRSHITSKKQKGKDITLLFGR